MNEREHPRGSTRPDAGLPEPSDLIRSRLATGSAAHHRPAGVSALPSQEGGWRLAGPRISHSRRARRRFAQLAFLWPRGSGRTLAKGSTRIPFPRSVS